MLTPPPAQVPPTEPSLPPQGPRRPGRVPLTLLVTALLASLLAGAVGGALGYVYADQNHGVVLGAQVDEQPTSVSDPPASTADAVDRVLPSVVTVRSTSSGGRSLGSGFVVTVNGYVITNDHVVGSAEADTTVTFHDGAAAPAKLVGRDPESDIAVLKVDRGGLHPIVFGDSEAVAVGDPVLAVGSPLALSNTVTSGIVSAVDRPIRAGDNSGQVRYYAAIQTDAAVNQGNSGGPLVDAAGRVVGINSVIKSVAPAASEAGNIGLAFAIPISQAKRVATEIIDTGQARRTVIGAELDRLIRSTGNGVRLVAVADGGPAAQAGMRAGDVVIRLEGHALEGPSDLVALVRKYDPGSVVTVEYERDGVPATVAVTLIADRG